MKRIIIKNKQGIQTHGAEMEDPTQWLADGQAGNWWGLQGRWKNKQECTADELLEILEERDVWDDLREKVLYTEVRLPQTYTIEEVDMTDEITQEQTRLTQIQNIRTRLKELDALPDLTASEVKEAIRKFIKLRRLEKSLD